MDLVCPVCRKVAYFEEVERPDGLARCPHCSATFAQKSADPSPASFAPRPEVEKPAHVSLDDSGHALTIWWSWLSWDLLPLGIFCLIWNAFFLAMGALLVLVTMGPQQGSTLFIVTVIFIGVGSTVSLISGYSLLTGLFNTTTVQLSGERIQMWHGPLPWLGSADAPAPRVRQLYCAIRVGGPSFTYRLQKMHDSYDLMALLDDGTKVIVVRGQADAKVIRFVEQQLEKRLRIQDERLPDEYLY